MDKIAVECPFCGHEAMARAEFIGKKTRCVKCEKVFVIQALPSSGGGSGTDEEENGQIKVSCPKCDEHFEIGAHDFWKHIVCKHCGSKVFLTEENVVKKYCLFCGKEMPQKATTCPTCKKKTDSVQNTEGDGLLVAIPGHGKDPALVVKQEPIPDIVPKPIVDIPEPALVSPIQNFDNPEEIAAASRELASMPISAVEESPKAAGSRRKPILVKPIAPSASSPASTTAPGKAVMVKPVQKA